MINRLYHRELIARMHKIDELEKKWNCKIDFPSTEMASDVVTISGPEYQVPQAVDEFLVCAFPRFSYLQVLTIPRGWFPKVMKSLFLRLLSSESSSSLPIMEPRYDKHSRLSMRSF